MVEFAKNLADFRKISLMDQVSLLKGGIIETLVLFSSRNYNHNGTIEQDETTMTQVDPALMISETSSKEHQGPMRRVIVFMRKLLQRIGTDKTIIKLLGVLSLFSPDRIGLSLEGRVLADGIQEDYAMVLSEYLVMTYPEQGTFFAEMIQMLVGVRDVGDKTRKMFASTDVGKLNPFVVELFDLDSKSLKI